DFWHTGASNLKQCQNRSDSGSNCRGITATRNRLASADQLFSRLGTDRKSTRLNSSHVKISYAVFCLKKKKIIKAKILINDIYSHINECVWYLCHSDLFF